VAALVLIVAGSWLAATVFVRLRENVSVLADLGVKPMDALLNGPFLPEFSLGFLLVIYCLMLHMKPSNASLSCKMWLVPPSIFVGFGLVDALRLFRQRKKAGEFAVSRGVLWHGIRILGRKARTRPDPALYVVPDDFRAWAGARIKPSVLIRRRWLDSLSRAEIDALAARQIARMQREYSLPIDAFILAAGFAAAAFTETLNLGPTGWLVAWFATVEIEILALSRYLPNALLAADLRAIQIGGDPEAFISARGELARLNGATLDTVALMMLAFFAGVPPSRARALLLDQPRPAADRYPTSGEYAEVGY
jgi:hypothetical protein